MLATDPERFVVACRAGTSADDDIVAFGSAIVRGPVWFLSMLFVRPDAQSGGLGRAVLQRILPEPALALTLATATDSAQPISNALYASLGIAPRLPLWSLTGGPGPVALPALPPGVTAVPFEEIAAGPDEGRGHAMLAGAVDELDVASLGFAHPVDHRYLRTTESRGFLYLGSGRQAIGYGYASPAGRIGPVAVRDEGLLVSVVGHLVEAVAPRGGQTIWVPGDAAPLLAGLLRSGYRLDGFPVLLSWSRPFGDFSRYLPTSPGLL